MLYGEGQLASGRIRLKNALLDNVGVVVNAAVHGPDDEEGGTDIGRVQGVDQARGPSIRPIVEGDGDCVGDSASCDESAEWEVPTI